MMERRPNAQLNVAAKDSLAVRAAAYARRSMYRKFIEKISPMPSETLLDVGVTSDRTYLASNYLEAWYEDKARITAVGVDDASFLVSMYPGLMFVQGDGCRLPFRDRSFDIVHSSAVIEHVGSSLRQKQFLSELVRVARRAVFVTTPDRWYPIEFHTLLPFVHWLPQRMFHGFLRATGRGAFADESVLNLLSASSLRKLASDVQCISMSVDKNWFLGLPSNLLLSIRLG